MTENGPESRLVSGCQIWRHFKPGIDHAPRELCLFVSVLGRQFNLMRSSATDEGMAVKPDQAEADEGSGQTRSVQRIEDACCAHILLCTQTLAHFLKQINVLNKLLRTGIW